MFAKILPLKGKHSGTKILIVDIPIMHTIAIWENADGIPSERSLHEHYGVTIQEWRDNIYVDDGSGDMTPIKNEYPCDGHFESQWQYDLCKKIVDAINK